MQRDQDRAAELETFKTEINFTAYAAGLGYELDEKASSRNSAVMVHPDGDKLIVGQATDGHWIYFSVRDGQDHGSVIDFDQRRGGGTLGDVRKRLRAWLGHPPTLPPRYREKLEPITRDLVQVRAELAGMYPADLCRRYLVDERNIPGHVLDDPRFAGRVMTDRRNNAVFPHLNEDGLCGYELKNKGFTGFAPGGVKGLWCSRIQPDDTRLVIAETAIDALSYAALFGVVRTRFVSTAGQVNPQQPDLLVSAAKKLARPEVQDCTARADAKCEIVLAVDHDQGGRELADKLTPLLIEAAPSAAVRLHHPEQSGDDWNDVLRSR